MTTRERVLTVLLGVTGIFAAAAIALAANAISGREIGLSAQPVSLAAKAPRPIPARSVEDRNDDHGGRAGSDAGGASGSSGPGFDDSGSSSSSGSGGGGSDDHGGPGTDSGSSGPSGSSGTSNPSGGDDHGGISAGAAVARMISHNRGAKLGREPAW